MTYVIDVPSDFDPFHPRATEQIIAIMRDKRPVARVTSPLDVGYLNTKEGGYYNPIVYVAIQPRKGSHEF